MAPAPVSEPNRGVPAVATGDAAEGDFEAGVGVDILIALERKLAFGIDLDGSDAELAEGAGGHACVDAGVNLGAAGVVVIGVVDDQAGHIFDHLREHAGAGDLGADMDIGSRLGIRSKTRRRPGQG